MSEYNYNNLFGSISICYKLLLLNFFITKKVIFDVSFEK